MKSAACAVRQEDEYGPPGAMETRASVPVLPTWDGEVDGSCGSRDSWEDL